MLHKIEHLEQLEEQLDELRSQGFVLIFRWLKGGGVFLRNRMRGFDLLLGFFQNLGACPWGLGKGQIHFALMLLCGTVQFSPKPPDCTHAQ